MIQERQNAFLIVPFWSPLASCTEKTAAQKLKVFRFSCFRLLVSCFLHTVLSKLNRVRVICFILELKVYCLKLPRKEVIQPHLPIRLPCYDFTPITSPTLDGCLLTVGSPASGVAGFRGVTGGVYKARERIHRDVLIRDY